MEILRLIRLLQKMISEEMGTVYFHAALLVQRPVLPALLLEAPWRLPAMGDE